MPTIRDFMSDIKASLGLGIDDAEWSDGALAYNIGLGIDKLRQRALSRDLRAADTKRVAAEVSTFVVPIEEDTTMQRRYITMPGPVYELPSDGGVVFVAYVRTDISPNCPPQVARVQYTPTTWQELRMLYGDPMQAPSPARPRYIRTRTRTYLFGQDQAIDKLEIGLLVGFPPLATIDIDGDIPLPEHMISDLRRMILQNGNWLMLQPQERLLNDGRANNVGTSPDPAPRLISVNDPSQQTTDD